MEADDSHDAGSYEDAESLDYEMGDFDSLVDLPEALQAYYEAEEVAAKEEEAGPASVAGVEKTPSGSASAVASTPRHRAGTPDRAFPRSHALDQVDLTDQLDKVHIGLCGMCACMCMRCTCLPRHYGLAAGEL